MSFPEYLNRIINSQLKNKEIQTVRSEITKLISTHRMKKDSNASEGGQRADKKLELPKYMANFFNINSSIQNAQLKLEPRKTFSQMHINRLKNRLTLQEEIKPQKQSQPGPQEINMNEWRQEMLKHLKFSNKKQSIQPKQELTQHNELEQTKTTFFRDRKRQIKGQTVSNPTLKRYGRRQKVKQLEKDDNNPVCSQKNIILIRPHPVTEEQFEENSTSKRKTTFKQKRASRKNDLHIDDEFTVQRLANFTALLPYLGTQKAKVKAREEKKFIKPFVQQQQVPEKIQIRTQRKAKRIPEEIIEITGWEIHQQT